MTLAYVFRLFLAMLIHELGHLAAARACGVGATELGIGWGPRVGGFTYGDVVYSLRALPVGAYVRLDMEELQRRPLSRQVFVLLAGVLVNLAAAEGGGSTWFGGMKFLPAAPTLPA